MLDQINISEVVRIAEHAWNIIMDIYESENMDIQEKNDDGYMSPLTRADTEANAYIVSELKKLYPTVNMLSEEEKEVPYYIRKDWEYFWCVDPLDGTKEFIKRNGDFTVNIALMHRDTPVLGVIYAPVHKTSFYSVLWQWAYKKKSENIIQLIHKTKKEINPKVLRVVASRSHRWEDLDAYVDAIWKQTWKEIQFVSVGSSLKFTLIADNQADMYPRFVPTMEWDTAAGQAILEELWYSIKIFPEGDILKYNRENLRNPFFIAE